jgi:zona occludens toxin (predicted ATPase)
MAFVETGNEGALNGATAVDIVPAPASGRHVVSKVNFYNNDTAAVTITLVKDKAGTDYELAKETLQPGENWNAISPDAHIVLDATDEKVQAFLSGAAATTNPDFDAAYAVVT